MNESLEIARKRKLRNFLINPRFQMKYVLMTAGTGIVMVFANVTIFYIFIRENYRTLISAIPMSGLLQLQLYASLRQIVVTMVLCSLLWIGMLCFLTLTMCHRAAGPLYRFKKVFEQIRDGNHESRVALRPNDDFREVAETFNSMLETLLPDGKGEDSK